jgi:hypothetical protein
MIISSFTVTISITIKIKSEVVDVWIIDGMSVIVIVPTFIIKR